MRTVSSSQHSFPDQILAGLPTIPNPTLLGEEVNEHTCQVVRTPQFRCLVVPWKRVMIVVPSLANRQETHDLTLHRRDSPGKERRLYFCSQLNAIIKLTCQKVSCHRDGLHYSPARCHSSSTLSWPHMLSRRRSRDLLPTTGWE